jgi:hypothetical protein
MSVLERHRHHLLAAYGVSDGPPNQRLHLTARRGHRGRDRVCYRCWFLAIQQSVHGAGKARPLGGGKFSSAQLERWN